MLANLKMTIAARRLKQADLAWEMQISASTFSEIVNGRRRPDASTRKRIAHRLCADEKWLFSTFAKIPKSEESE
jgi:transcriptional regulator with XRE-family HTH domain